MLPLRRNSVNSGERGGGPPGSNGISRSTHRARILQLPSELDLLNRLTIGHVVAGFMAFRAQFIIDDAQRLTATWLDRQAFAELEAQQQRVDQGIIDREQFASSVERLIGDPTSNVAFAGLGFWGGPLNCTPRHRFSRLLGMTTAQRSRARTIHREMHDAIDAARQAAHRDIRAELNDRQVATLNDPFSPLRANALCGLRPPFIEELTSTCGLKPDQLASIKVLCALLRTAVRARHERGRMRFLRTLTPAQRQLLEVIEHVQTLKRAP